jgi:hypothetical protein
VTAPEGDRSLPPDRRAVVRLARAGQRLDQHRSEVAELRELVHGIDALQLVPVEGEKWLIGQLEVLLTQADEAARQIAAGAPVGALNPLLHQLDQLLEHRSWTVATATLGALRRLRDELDAEIRRLREDRITYQLWFSSVADAVAAATAAGADVSAPDRALAAALRPVQEAAADADAGRYDKVAITVAQARQLLQEQGLLPDGDSAGAQAGLQERIDTITAAGDLLQAADQRRNRKTELFLISVPAESGPTGTDSAVEYRVLLRRPSFESEQESNLHTAVRLRPQDQAGFRGMADDIAAAAIRGVRAAVDDPQSDPAAGTRLILRTAPDRPGPDGEGPAERLTRVGKLMYGLLISDAMQRLIAESDCALTVTSNDLELPWELMHDGENFLCVKRAFARMPIGEVYPRRTRPSRIRPRTPWRVLLIHADPYHADPDRRLGAAQREVEAIAERLKTLVPEENIRILRPAEATVDAITRHLSSGDYDVVHYAGHAGFDPDDPTRSHLVVHEGDEFSADRIQKVLEGRPVVFLNACDTSRARNAAESPGAGLVARAQGLASAFVYGGAHACVGSLWPVFDDSARDFAVSFYDRLFHRQRIGEALAQARQQSREKNLDRLTWASYALYGDPLHRLRDAPSPTPTSAGRTGPAATT